MTDAIDLAYRLLERAGGKRPTAPPTDIHTNEYVGRAAKPAA